MIYQTPLISHQYQQVLQIFSNFLNDTVLVINTVKKSIYQILNIHLHSTEVFVNPNLPSVSANCKKTLDDLKRISSILRGYSKSKNVQRQEEQTRRSRIENSSYSRESRSRNSRVSYNSNASGSENLSRFKKPQSITYKQQIDMVTFEIPKQKKQNQGYENEENSLILKNHRSLRNLNKNIQDKNAYYQVDNPNKQSNINYTFSSPQPIKTHSIQRKRAKTLEDQPTSRQSNFVLNGTQIKLKECLQKHQCGINQIIQRNTECLQMLKDIQNNLKKRKSNKQKKQKKTIKNYSQPKPQQRKYQAMTPSFPKSKNTAFN